jgi:dephospho-CoA kinase
MGDAVRDEAGRQGLEPTDANLGRLMLKLRQEKGPGAVAHLVIEKLTRDSVDGNIVIDGIRSNPEVEVLRKFGEVRVLAIHASQDVRFRHVKQRARSDAPSTADEFAGRDKRELSVGISDAIALADETISNNGLTLDQLREQADAIIDQWLAETKEQ